MEDGFACQIVQWQVTHGRHALPWQNTRDPYRVWLSEIMLQQTQVSTVLDYYTRFVERFPEVEALAAADADEVMGLWAGLGYYSRARNLHRCAQNVVALHGGAFPRTAQQLQTLPGIGRSTAAAIASFCFGERVAILDVNVIRVLTRVLGFANDLALSANERQLWDLATGLLPEQDLPTVMPRYTQGLMDLGATVCTTRKPQCLLCPVQRLCVALATGQPELFPVKTRKIKRSALGLSLLWAQRPDGAVWLEKRPVPGIWGGLYCLPVFDSDEALLAALPASLHAGLQPQAHFLHVLTHKDLYLAPWVAQFQADQSMPSAMLLAARGGAWFSLQAQATLGVPAPIRKLLASQAAF
ncbi:MAG: A/G-specific adenine glycosylase [Polaromonas sp.]|nr:A/G-specific adenine glycosylase [Polaromonas sp.]